MKIKNIRRVVIVDDDNNLVSLLTNRDILKHVKGNYTRILQNKIKHAQEIMDFLPEPIVEIYYTNDDDIIYWMNTQAKKIFGDNLIDKNVSKIIPKESWDYIKDILIDAKVLKDYAVKIEEKMFEISGTVSKNIETNYIKLILKDVSNYEEQKLVLQKTIDMEIKKRLDSEYLMMQQSKLATMGEMIGHIAHQWRQPLAQLGGIFMNLESAFGFGEMDEKYLNKKLDNGNKLIKYMSATIEDFRHFFEPNKEKEIFLVYEYIKNAINIIDASLTFHHIQVSLDKPKRSLYSIGYPSEFSQVILNILANAQDILVSKKVEKPKIDIELSVDHENIFIQIRDNGGGIKKENIDKIFDIYFTTKPRKQGSGLGLYMSKLIIETKLGGVIKVVNDSQGAVFTIGIPSKNSTIQ